MNNTKYILISGAFGGLLSSIPCLNYLNLCFCLIIGCSAWLGLHLWLEEVEADDRVTLGSIAVFGGISGAISGLITAFISSLVFLIFYKDTFHSILEAALKETGISLEGISVSGPGFIMLMLSISVLYYTFLYAAAGSLWSISIAHLFYKEKLI